MRNVPLHLSLAALSALVLAAAGGGPANAQQSPKSPCPAGYSLTLNICISDATGDVVNPEKRKVAAKRRTVR
jgi:hypothetical protein